MQKINSKIGNRVVDTTSNGKSSEQISVDNYNKQVGDLKYYDCPICKNKGLIAVLNSEGRMAFAKCKCSDVRKTNKRIVDSGLSDLIGEYQFDKYEATEDWQKQILAKAKEFVSDEQNKWFFIGGQSGSGKTHICTGIVGELIKRGKAAMYMLWRDDVVKLKANVNNFDVYESLMNDFKTAPILYIDDFFNVDKGKEPSPADVNIAFELLNYRYNNPDLITIISSEFTTKDIIQIAENVGGRIHERTKQYRFNIAPDIKKNYRLR